MEVQSAKYTYRKYNNEKTGVIAIIDGVEMFVPLNGGNRHYRAIREWEAEGNIITTPAPDVDVADAPVGQAAWASLRSTRNAKLAASDWTQVADAPVDQAAWATYRQALRDLPANTVDPSNPVWPQEP